MGKWSQPTARKVLAVKPSLNCSCWREHTFSCWMSLSFWILASTLRSWGSITTALRSSRSGRFRAGASLGLEAKGRPFCNCLGITKGLNFFRFRSIGCGIKQHNKQRGVCQQEEKTRQKDFNVIIKLLTNVEITCFTLYNESLLTGTGRLCSLLNSATVFIPRQVWSRGCNAVVNGL